MMRRKRAIKLNLSDEECDLLYELCGKYDITIGKIFESFIGDLVDSDYSIGSDGRHYITSWFSRCFEETTTETLLSYLVCQYDVREFLYLVDAIARAEQALEDYKTNSAQYDPKELEFLEEVMQENLEYWKGQYNDIISEWLEGHPKADPEKEIENVRTWYQEKERMINE